MEGIEASSMSSFSEGIEASSMSSFSEASSMSSIEPGPSTEREHQEKRRRMMFLGFLCLLLLLLLLLGLYLVFSSQGGAEEESDEGKTQAAHYSSGNPSSPSTGSRKPLPTEKANDPTRAPPTPPATHSTTVKRTVKITTPRKTTTTRKPSTGYGYTVCTIGRAGYDATMIPINEELCEIVIYTHVYVDLKNSTSISTTGRVPYLTFQKVARRQRGSKFMRFGVSYSPLALPLQLTANPSVNDRFLKNALEAFNASGFTVFGTIGLEKKIMDLKHEPALIKWYQALAGIQQRVPNATLFLGVRVLDDGKLLSTKENLAKDLFQTVRDMKVTLVIFVTHNSFSMGNISCTTVPVSSWSANALQKPAGPALEQMLKFLEFGLKGEKTIEVALSSTLSFVMFEMKKAVKRPVKFGEKCVRSELLFSHEYCFEMIANVQEDVDTMTALGFVGTTLFSFETPTTIEKKVRKFVIGLDDKVFRRVGWALFDLGQEIYNRSICTVKNVISRNFPRLAVVKPILLENRNRKFNG